MTRLEALYIESKYTKDNDAKGHYMWGIQVATGSPHSKELLCTLYCGIHYILRESLYLCEPIQTPVPLYKTKLRLLTEDEKCRVFLDEETQFVYKYFKDSFEHPNQDLLISVSGFEDVEVEKVAETLTVLRYRYISGNHEPQKVGEFRGVIKILTKLHDRGYVHSDVRAQNIVFNGNDSVLIDYDLIAKVGTVYPQGYNNKFKERHPDAASGWKRMKSHDIHSLLVLMGMCSTCTSKFKASLGEMKTRLDLIDEKGTREEAEFDKVETSLETLEKSLARILKEILEKLDDRLEHVKTRRVKKE